MAEDAIAPSPGRSGAFLPAEDHELAERYARVAAQARRSMITMLVTKGRPVEEIAAELHLPVEQVRKEIEDAISAARKILHMVPEGPLFITEHLARGISDIVGEILMECRDGLKRAKTEKGDKEHSNIQGYMRISFDVMDKYAERMARLGLVVDRGSKKKTWGPGIKIKDPEEEAENAMTRSFQERAVHANFNVERAELEAIAAAEGRTIEPAQPPAEPESPADPPADPNAPAVEVPSANGAVDWQKP